MLCLVCPCNIIGHVIKVGFELVVRITGRLIAWDREETPFPTFVSPIARRGLFMKKETLKYVSSCNSFEGIVALGGFVNSYQQIYQSHLED